MASIVWSPGVGDPTLGGWIAVVAYFFAAVLALAASRKALLFGDSNSVPFWTSVCGLLVLLGLNKQLDLQTLLTEVGRHLAESEGWLDYRRAVQLAFVVTVGAAGLLAFALIAKQFWQRQASFRWAIAGLLVQLFFVIIRAASFNHVYLFIDGTLFGFRWNLLIELLSISMMAFGAALYRVELPQQELDDLNE